MNALGSAFTWLTQAQQWHGGNGIPERLVQHLQYVGISLAIAALIALPTGLLTGHTGRGGFVMVSLANFGRALPTLGLVVLAFALALRYIGPSGTSAAYIVPLVALAIPPILVNAYEGVLGVDPGLTDAARGMGMTGRQLLVRVETPVALPLILLGLRTAAIQVVATATIAAYVGLGGLGRYVIDGLATNDYAEVAGGAVLVVLLALAVQAAFAGLRWLIVPAGLRTQVRTG